MITIPISGIIANFEYEEESNVTPSSLRKSLNDANGEDILVTINSPGGGVFAGLEMFSLLKNYSGNVETRVVSLAASMGSVLALAGDKMSAESTAMYFIHNAQSMAAGDYRELAKESKWLKDISNLIANLYEKYTSLSLKDATDLMDADTQFFGKDLELLGFDIVDVGADVDESQARVNAQMKFSEVANKIKNENYSDDLEKVAASIDFEKYGLKTKITGSQDEPDIIINPAMRDKQEDLNMSLKDLLAQNPAAQIEHDNEIKAQKEAGFNEGKESLQASITSASKYLAPDGAYPPAIQAIALDVLNGKKTVEALETTVAAFDALKESQNSANAQLETDATGDTPAEQSQAVSENGEIKNELDFNANLKAARQAAGLEV